MGFDERLVPKLREAMAATALRVGAVRCAADVRAFLADAEGRVRALALEELAPERVFVPHPGWRGHLEALACAG